MRLKLLQIKEATSVVVNGPRSVVDEMAEEAKADREAMWVVHLNTKNRIIEKELAALGALNQSPISLRELFRKAVMVSSAAIITVHNHPSGEPSPSPEDRKVWDQVISAGKLLGIEVLDNLVIAPAGRYYSDREARPDAYR